MTTQAITEDYQATRSFTAAPAAVLAALTTLDGLAGWWSPVTGSTEPGAELTFSFGQHGSNTVRVEEPSPAGVRWTVLTAEPAPEWDGTSICFDIEPSDGGSVLRFRHRGLTPQLACYDDCYSGWAWYLDSLVDHVDRGAGRPFGS